MASKALGYPLSHIFLFLVFKISVYVYGWMDEWMDEYLCVVSAQVCHCICVEVRRQVHVSVFTSHLVWDSVSSWLSSRLASLPAPRDSSVSAISISSHAKWRKRWATCSALRSLCFHGKYFTYWATSPAPSFMLLWGKSLLSFVNCYYFKQFICPGLKCSWAAQFP